MGVLRSALAGMTAAAPRSLRVARKVEGLVGDERADRDAGEKRLDADAVVPLAGQQDEARQIAQRIDKSDDL
jgi:hypothetical protein